MYFTCLSRGGRGRRKSNPGYFLAKFAAKLKDFEKVCTENSNWKSTFDYTLNRKLSDTEREHSIDLDNQSKRNCVVNEARKMKDDFAKLILSTHGNSSNSPKRQYCECSGLIKARIRKGRGYSSPLSNYKRDIDAQCRKSCSNTLEIEYEE